MYTFMDFLNNKTPVRFETIIDNAILPTPLPNGFGFYLQCPENVSVPRFSSGVISTHLQCILPPGYGAIIQGNRETRMETSIRVLSTSIEPDDNMAGVHVKVRVVNNSRGVDKRIRRGCVLGEIIFVKQKNYVCVC